MSVNRLAVPSHHWVTSPSSQRCLHHPEAAERLKKTLSACLMHKSVSVCLHIHSHLPSCFDMWFRFSSYVHAILTAHEHFLCCWFCLFFFLYALFFLASSVHLFLIISPSHICLSSDFSAYLSSVCVSFVCLFIWKRSMSCTKTIWCVCWENRRHVLHISMNLRDRHVRKRSVCVRACVRQIWRRPTYRDNLSIKSH